MLEVVYASQDFGLIKVLCGVLFYCVLSAVWSFPTQMAQYNGYVLGHLIRVCLIHNAS